MRKALVADGVPPRVIFEDHAGLDTWATMVRARGIFDVRDAVVVTQGFHMPRALYLADAAGIHATGLTSDLHPYGFQGEKSVTPSAVLSAELPRGTERILLVEDEPGVRAMVRRVLEGCGYTVIEASDGDEALQTAQLQQQSGIDLLLTDVVMPRLGGARVAVACIPPC